MSRVLNGSPEVRAETQYTVQASIDVLGYRPNASARTLGRARRPRTSSPSSAVVQVRGDVPDAVVATLIQRRVATGITGHNAGLWSAPAAATTDHLGWTDTYRTLQHLLPQLRRLHDELTTHGLTKLVVIGTNPNAEIISALRAVRGRTISFVDTPHPARIGALLEEDLAHTAFIIDTRDTSAETDALLRIVQHELQQRDLYAFNGRIVIIADHGTVPQKLAVAVGYPLIETDRTIPAVFTGLDAHTLVPAALANGNIERLLKIVAQAALLVCRDAEDNPALRLAAALASDQVHGVVLSATPSLEPMLPWLQRLLLSTLDLPSAVDDGASTHPGMFSVRIASSAPSPSPTQGLVVEGLIGAQMLTWQYAVAAASVILNRNPFESDQPAQTQLPYIRRQQTRLTGASAPTEQSSSVLTRRTRAITRFIKRAPEGAIIAHVYGSPAQHGRITAALRNAAARLDRELLPLWSPHAEHTPGVPRAASHAHLQLIVTTEDRPVPAANWTLMDLVRARAREAADVLRENDCPVLTIEDDISGLLRALASVSP